MGWNLLCKVFKKPSCYFKWNIRLLLNPVVEILKTQVKLNSALLAAADSSAAGPRTDCLLICRKHLVFSQELE